MHGRRRRGVAPERRGAQRRAGSGAGGLALAALPVCSGKEAVRAFERLGYEVVRQKGSHVRMRRQGRKLLTVPLRKEMKAGTLRGLISTSGFTVEEFNEAL